jgi:hypothetical protein
LPIAALAAALIYAAPASAEELTTKVYGATLEPGMTEVELRYGRLNGGPADGEDGLLVESAHHFSRRFYAGVETQWSRRPGDGRRFDGAALEAIVTLGRVAGIDTAVLAEFGAHRHGPESVETKLLLQKRAGKFDARLNLRAEKELESGEPVEFGYAASADTQVIGEFRLGAVAIGELGTSRHLTTRAGHFIGPVAKFELESLPGKGELEFETGYLFALGEERDEAKGQFRLLVEYGFRF